LYKKASDLGNPGAQYALAYIYDKEIGVEADKNKAFDYYLSSAKQGEASAQVAIGDFYRDGEVVGKNLKKAFFWYDKAKAKGSEEGEKK
jgi:TPR repeat protein